MTFATINADEISVSEKKRVKMIANMTINLQLYLGLEVAGEAGKWNGGDLSLDVSGLVAVMLASVGS